MMWKALALTIATGLALGACGSDDTNAPDDTASIDGTQKVTSGKDDRWDWRNDPARFRAELVYDWRELPQEGKAKKTAWADTYWPTYEDSVNARWQGASTLSPIEKYDKAFNAWSEPEGFMELKPYDSTSCEWDDAYYEALGPAADWVSRNKGNWKSHNGVDDDGDGLDDADECGWGDEEKDRDGVETWWGLCHAWVPAAILEDEPLKAVEHNGVTFEVSDLKALLILQYDRSDAYMLGGRCNEQEVERDDTGRIPDSECRDVNAGSFHVIVTNFLGLQERAIAEDRTFDYEVWNQPVVEYAITNQEEMALEDVLDLLQVDDPLDEEAQPSTDDEVSAVLRLANEYDEATLVDDAGLREEEAKGIVAARAGEDGLADTEDDVVFEDLATLEEVYGIGPRVLTRLLFHAREIGWAPEPEPRIYSYNPDAAKFVRVSMTLNYITESHAMTTPTGDQISRYTRHDYYDYILEIDEDEKVIGGEWVGSSIQSHPDFLWLPLRARYGNPHVELDAVRELVALSREEEMRTVTFGADEALEIPDNSPEGVVSEVVVTDEGQIQALHINLEIAHTYRGDLLVELEKEGAQTVVLFDGYEVESRWEDDVMLEGEVVSGFEGLELQGTWRVKVYDSLQQDTGALNAWSISADVK